jgi:hypothetical protein
MATPGAVGPKTIFQFDIFDTFGRFIGTAEAEGDSAAEAMGKVAPAPGAVVRNARPSPTPRGH